MRRAIGHGQGFSSSRFSDNALSVISHNICGATKVEVVQCAVDGPVPGCTYLPVHPNADLSATAGIVAAKRGAGGMLCILALLAFDSSLSTLCKC